LLRASALSPAVFSSPLTEPAPDQIEPGPLALEPLLALGGAALSLSNCAMAARFLPVLVDLYSWPLFSPDYARRQQLAYDVIPYHI